MLNRLNCRTSPVGRVQLVTCRLSLTSDGSAPSMMYAQSACICRNQEEDSLPSASVLMPLVYVGPGYPINKFVVVHEHSCHFLSPFERPSQFAFALRMGQPTLKPQRPRHHVIYDRGIFGLKDRGMHALTAARSSGSNSR